MLQVALFRAIRCGALVALCAVAVRPAQAQADLQTENVVLITLDGLRWQELFTGADPALIRNDTYVDQPEALAARFWADAPEERRRLLMPFFWSEIAKHGQLYGNRLLDCPATVTNNRVFSYPGYNEILTGFADPAIDSNAKRPNANTTVLEFIHGQEGFDGRVAAFGSWDVFPYIINEERSGIPVNAGFEPAASAALTERELFLNELQEQIPSPWGSVRLDAFTHHFALEHARKTLPRLLYVAYGETDDFAHDADYEAYLKSAHQTDAFIRDLWEFVQGHGFYQDKTTFVITTDHGRGTVPLETWTGHGTDIDGADQIWIAVLGPDAPALGEISECTPVYQNQVAATVAALLGSDYQNTKPVGAPLPSALGR